MSPIVLLNILLISLLLTYIYIVTLPIHCVYVEINDQIITFHLKCPSHYDSRFDWFECFQLEMAYTIKHR